MTFVSLFGGVGTKRKRGSPSSGSMRMFPPLWRSLCAHMDQVTLFCSLRITLCVIALRLPIQGAAKPRYKPQEAVGVAVEVVVVQVLVDVLEDVQEDVVAVVDAQEEEEGQEAEEEAVDVRAEAAGAGVA